MNTAEVRYTYEELEERVQAYKAGEPGAAERLIEAFRGYLIRWLQVLNGRTVYSDKYHRTFVSLYISSRGKRMRILHGDPRGIGQFNYWSGIIRERYACLSREEKWHELVVCLLELAQNYNPWENIKDFHTYVMRSFPYYLHRRLEGFAGDPAGFSRIVIPLLDNPDYEECPDVPVPATTDDPDLGAAWVMGATAGPGFCRLTPMERQILLYYYVHGLSDREIAERLGVGRCTINRRRIAAKRKLAKALEEDGWLD